MARASGASVILVNGQLAAFLRRRNPDIRVFLPESEPELTRVALELSQTLALVAHRRQTRREGLLIHHINAELARDHALARHLEDAGFVSTASGFQMRRTSLSAMPPPEPMLEDHDAVEPV